MQLSDKQKAAIHLSVDVEKLCRGHEYTQVLAALAPIVAKVALEKGVEKCDTPDQVLHYARGVVETFDRAAHEILRAAVSGELSLSYEKSSIN